MRVYNLHSLSNTRSPRRSVVVGQFKSGVLLGGTENGRSKRSDRCLPAWIAPVIRCCQQWRDRFNSRQRWIQARRKPSLLFRLPSKFLLRFAERQFELELLKLPPRLTRLEPPLITPANSVNAEAYQRNRTVAGWAKRLSWKETTSPIDTA